MLQVKKVHGLVLFLVVALVQVWGGGWAEGQLLDPVQVIGGEEVALDPNRVLARVGDDELLAWQAEVILSKGLGRNLSEAANEWIRLTLRALEAHRRGMHEKREVAFQLGFRMKFDLAIFIFEEQILAGIPEVADEEVKARYDRDIELYVKPMVVDIQHLMIPQRELADKIAMEARKPEVSFDSLVVQWARGNDKATKGYMYGATYDFLKEIMGARVADEIRLNNGPGIVGPVTSQNGYEVIKIHKFVPGLNRSLEQAKESLRETLRSDNYRNTLDEIDEKLAKEIDVFRSDEVKKVVRDQKEIR